MKYRTSAITAILAGLFVAASCQKEKLDPESVIVVNQTSDNAFDLWLKKNYLEPYNIQFKYRFEQNEADLNYFTVPAHLDDAIKMANLVKYLCIETYNEVAGEDFTKGNFPKMFFLVGEWMYNNNGTFVLGTAEGGKKIMLTGLNYLEDYLYAAEDLNEYYIRTIHHEFTHILNQTKPYQTDFKLVTASGYVADNWNSEPYDSKYLSNGFVTAYAQREPEEDFAETLSMYVTHDEEWWDAFLSPEDCNRTAILSKVDFVRSYLAESWGTDLDKLRDVIVRRQQEVINGEVDLTDISIK
jgi:hypothetical protein